MQLTWRDGLATGFVFAGALLYGLWLTGVVPAESELIAAVVLALGLAASVTAVVYGVGAGLLRAPKVYLVVASLIGVAASVAGGIAVATGDEAMLATLVTATVLMWLLSTIRHATAQTMTADDEEAEDTFRAAA